MKKMKLLVLMVIVSSFGLNACSADFYDIRMNSSEPTEVLLEKSIPVGNKGELKIETAMGNIKVQSWDKNEVNVKITGTDNLKERLDFTVENHTNNVSIVVNRKDKKRSIHNANLKIEVIMPKHFRINANTRGGNIAVEEIYEEIKVSTSGGNININKIKGDVEAITSGGNITSRNTIGIVKLNTSGGNISVSNQKGDLKAKTSGGNIDCEVKDGKVVLNTSGGQIDLDYEGENKGIDLSTSAGSIDIKVPDNFKADLDLETSAGNVNCKLPLSNVDEKSAARIKASINNGGSLLKAKTSAGSIRVD